MKRKNKNKQWRDRRSRVIDNSHKDILRTRKKNHQGVEIQYKLGESVTKKTSLSNSSQNKRSTVKMPSNFSIIDNDIETIKCFETIDKKIRLPITKKVFLDFSEVENLTIDALMYLIAFMKNCYKRGYYKPIMGNYPVNDAAKSILMSSGFLDYVKHLRDLDEEQVKNETSIMITVGSLVKPEVLANVCNLVQRAFSVDRIYTMFIYEMIGELMANTEDHAFIDEAERKKVVNSWYLYVLIEDKKAKITVLDTGLGIPATIRKRLLEKLRDGLPFAGVDDSTYIFEALHGKHKNRKVFSRSRTEDENRNKGLPAIYNRYVQGKIMNLKIISNYGICSCVEEKQVKKDLQSRLPGTLLYWEIVINNESEVA